MQVGYVQLFKTQPAFFIFSVFSIFFSAPGQTFLISLAIPLLCNTNQISPLTFAGLYASSTLCASFALPLIGRLIDRKPIQWIILLNAGAFSTAMILIAVSNHPPILWIGLCLARLFGQGALPLSATAHTIKRFTIHRGRALSLTQLGYPLSESIFPIIFLGLLSTTNVTVTYFIFALFIPIIYIPLSLLHVKNKDSNVNGTTQKTNPCNQTHASSSQALKDPLLPIYLTISAIPPIIMTAAFYFQMNLFNQNNWDVYHIANAILCYAILKLIATLMIGPVIDKIGVPLPLIFITLILGIATSLIVFKQTVLTAYIYYGLFGIGIGAAATTMSSLWGLLYGSKAIGEIKGIIAIVRNGGTAVSPLLFSWLHNSVGIRLTHLFLISGMIILGIATLPMILKKIDPRLSPAISTD